ncbi:hypothetical protein HDU96_008989 [Phlyctochytrium bullatum]|nr:hypothetical protein HDU96_008989 [Phlyctochytrium bullatum]
MSQIDLVGASSSRPSLLATWNVSCYFSIWPLPQSISPLHSTLWSYGDFSFEIFEFLVNHGANTEARVNGETPLLSMTKDDCVPARALKILLDWVADTEARNEDGYTALHIAASKGQTECIQVLLDAGADINAPDWEGNTPLGLATKAGTLDAAQILRDHGASAQYDIPLGVPPLYSAIGLGNYLHVGYLLFNGTDHCSPNYMLKPQLHFAIARRNFKAALLLLDFGADPNERCLRERTALHWWALSYDWGAEAEMVLEVLVSRGVDLNALHDNGYTALHAAASELSLDLCLPLLALGARGDVLNHDHLPFADVALNAVDIHVDFWLDANAAQLAAYGVKLWQPDDDDGDDDDNDDLEQ